MTSEAESLPPHLAQCQVDSDSPARPSFTMIAPNSEAISSSDEHAATEQSHSGDGGGGGWSYEWDLASTTINHSNAKISINVSSPELISSMMSKHVVYSVKTEPLGYTVRRRYNDFAWLRETLCAAYAGLFVPSIPATSIFSTKRNITGSKTDVGGDFVKNRMAQLNQFMAQLCKIPFLRTDPSLAAFVSLQSEKEFKQFADAAAAAATASPAAAATMGKGSEAAAHNEGLQMWLALVDKTVINPHDADRCISDFKRQIEVLRATLDGIDKQCRIAGKRAMQAAQAMGALADHVAAWSATEDGLLDPARNEHVSAHGTRLRVYMGALAAGQAGWAQNVGLVPKVIARVLMSSVQFQLVQVEGFRVHLQQRDAVLKELERAEREKLRALEEKHRAKASGGTPPRRSSVSLFGKRTDELEEAVAKKSEAVAALQLAVDRLNKGLVFCEIDRFHRERTQSMAQLVGSLAATHMQISQAATTKWSETVALSGLDTSAFTDCVSAVYTHLDDEDIFGDV